MRSGGKPPHPPAAHTGPWPNLPVGGGARLAAVRRIAPAIFATGSGADTGRVCGAWRCVASGMVLSRADSPPQWLSGATESFTAAATPEVLNQYREAQPLTLGQPLMR